ncbi:MAG TPA: HAD hydrolase-like protein [Pirellulaceae bacterium]|nr:HAD hydrolase-like protein [Pirellulaceae bacterium]
MTDEGWNGIRLELAAIELGGPENRRSSHVRLGCEIQGVVFEPCGVLYDDSAWRRWLWQLATRMGLSSHYTPFFRVWECEFQEDVWSGRLDLWAALSQFLRSAGMSRPDIDEVIAASRAKFRRFDQETRPFPDVRSTVRQLHTSGIQIAVIVRARLGATKIRQRLDQVGIGKLVTRVLSQQGEAAHMESAEWYQATLEALPGPARNWAFVGRQQAGLDVAHSLGLLTVALNHDADAAADIYIEQFSQLGQLLQRQGSAETAYSSAKAA